MSEYSFDISIVIVNYNVKEYLSNLLNSIKKASGNLRIETFVVDNVSTDGSKEFIPNRFPEVNYIYNEKNVGFGIANNQAIELAQGKYILIINPDTLVSEDTLTTMLLHMEMNEKCGAAGCKILNPDGTFAPESRRSVPSIWTAATKLFGLSTIFPKSKLFGQYYLSWMDEDEPSQVPVLSGSFMFWRGNVLKELNLKYIKLFNKALYQFFEKQYGLKYSYVFKVLIYLAIMLKTITSFIVTQIKKSAVIITDLLILNLSLFVGFGIRFGFDLEIMFTLDKAPFLYVNLIVSFIYIVAAGVLGLFKENSTSLSAHIKSIFVTFIGIVIITFFARELAFSRLILGLSFVIGTVFTILHRLWVGNKMFSGNQSIGGLRNSKIIIVGTHEKVQHIVSKINSRPDWNYEVVGIVTPGLDQKDENSQVIGSLPQLSELINAFGVEQVFFSLGSISYKQMLSEISKLKKEETVFKLIPESMEFILGKSNVEYLESIPLVKVEFEYSKPSNKFLKRSLDLIISIPMLLILILPIGVLMLFSKAEDINIKGLNFYKNGTGRKWRNRLKAVYYICIGKMSLVGASLNSSSSTEKDYKLGITGLVQINQSKIVSDTNSENFDLYYLQNYSIWVDIDILAKSMLNRYTLSEQIDSIEEAKKS